MQSTKRFSEKLRKYAIVKLECMAKRIIVLVLATVCALGVVSAKKPHVNKYRRVWTENFRGKTFDKESWSKIPRGYSDWDRHMSDYDGLYEVSGGCLKLRCIANNGVVPADTARYITGGLYTLGKRSVNYGKVEIKAKLGEAKGLWPAFWLLPEKGKWPDAGEIDIMEHLNFDTIAYQTVHSGYTFTLGFGSNPPHGATGPIKRGEFNVYAVEILPDSLVFSINGSRTFAYPRIDTPYEGQYPFGTPFYLLLDMQVEGSWVGRADGSGMPAVMEIDWVRMYELKQPKANHSTK